MCQKKKGRQIGRPFLETYGLAAVPMPSQARTSAEAGILVTAAVDRG
jgi:hypothetical protein